MVLGFVGRLGGICGRLVGEHLFTFAIAEDLALGTFTAGGIVARAIAGEGLPFYGSLGNDLSATLLIQSSYCSCGTGIGLVCLTESGALLAIGMTATGGSLGEYRGHKLGVGLGDCCLLSVKLGPIGCRSSLRCSCCRCDPLLGCQSCGLGRSSCRCLPGVVGI